MKTPKPHKDEATVASDAARTLVGRRWAKTTPEQRSEYAAWLSAQRTPEGRRAPKRPDQPRCPCGVMTLKRAQARRHKCEAPAPEKAAQEKTAQGREKGK